MKSNMVVLAAFSLIAAGLATPVLAQGTPQTPPATQQAPANTQQAPANRQQAPTTQQSTQLEAGANSFTEDQARSRIEAAGFQNVTGLSKDDQGIWRGRATRNGQQVTVGLDYRGNIAAQ